MEELPSKQAISSTRTPAPSTSARGIVRSALERLKSWCRGTVPRRGDKDRKLPGAARVGGSNTIAGVADSDIEQLVRVRPSDLKKRPPALKRCGCCDTPFSKAVKPTDDHVISRAFISEPVPPNLPTWRVCLRCQQLLSPAEDRLRNVMAAVYSRHP